MPDLGPLELVLAGLVVVAAVMAYRRSRATLERGQEFLARWGIDEPTAEQCATVVHYLRQRRQLYPFVFVLLLIGVWVYDSGGRNPGVTVVLPLIAAIVATLLVAEFVAAVRPQHAATRTATLVRRGVTDLVPRYAVVVYAGVTAIALIGVGVTVAFQPWIDAVAPWRLRHDGEVGPGAVEVDTWAPQPISPTFGWLILAATVLTALAVATIVWLSLVRAPMSGGAAVDAALRVRTARVAVGVGLLLTAALALELLGTISEVAARAEVYVAGQLEPPPDLPVPPDWLPSAGSLCDGLVAAAFIGGLVVWGTLVNPRRRPRLVEASR